MLTSKQRAFLRGKAQNIDTIFQVGKAGILDETVIAVDNALTARELIKLRVLETCPGTPRQTADELSVLTHSDTVQVIGSKIVLFRQNKENSQFDIKHI